MALKKKQITTSTAFSYIATLPRAFRCKTSQDHSVHCGGFDTRALGTGSAIDDTRERDPQPNASKRPAGRFRNSRADRRWATGGFACPWRQKWHYTAPAQSAENPARPRRPAAQTSRTSVADAL